MISHAEHSIFDAAKPRLLLVDDEETIRKTVGGYLRGRGYQVDAHRSPSRALEAIEGRSFDMALVEPQLPQMSGLEIIKRLLSVDPQLPFIVITHNASTTDVIEALHYHAVDFMLKPLEMRKLEHVLSQTPRRMRRENHGSRLLGESQGLARVRRHMQTVIDFGCDTVLITGETGTGKELVANEIHRLSKSKGELVAVSAPALPETLVESELFGTTKGAFTGASNHAGAFERANGGTLFLDEVGDMSLDVQAKLLRALETRTIRRVGSTQEVPVDLTVVAATNQPIQQMVEQGTFRRDLYHRLELYPIHIPPLRERREDIIPLAHHFVEQFCLEYNLPAKGFSTEGQQWLLRQQFLGNVRELSNMVRRAAIRVSAETHHHVIHLRHLASRDLNECFDQEMSSVEEQMDPETRQLIDALEKTRWNRRKAAKLLKMPYSTLRYKISKLNIA